MMTWQRSAPSNPITQTHQHNLFKGKDSLSKLPELQEEETLEFQEEYPREVAAEAEEEEGAVEEDIPPSYLYNKQTPATSSLAICHSFSQGIERSPKHS